MKNLLWLLMACLLGFALMAPSLAAADEILVYTALEDDEIPKYLEIFKKEHPDIDVKIVRDSAGIVTAKILAEKDDPRPT